MKSKIKKVDEGKTRDRRILYIDFLNVMAILAVLFLHHNGIVHRFSDQMSWYSSLIFECVFYFAVPVFVMISGAMLMNYREKYNTKVFFKKRALKVLVPIIFWFTFVFIWKVFIVQTMDVNDWSIGNILNMILQCKIEPIYYFLFLILGVYLTMPILSRLVRPEYQKTLWYLVATFFILNALVPNLLAWMGVTYNGGTNVEHGTIIGIMMSQWAMYVVLGYLLSTTEVPKKYRIVLYCLAIAGLVYRYVTTAVLSAQVGSLVRTSWGYGQFHTIILASAVFLFIKNMKFDWTKRHEKIVSLLGKLAGCSFGVYLIHKIMIYYEVILLDINTRSIWWRTFGVFLTYGVSVLIVLAIKKIPVLKRIVP